MTTELKSVNSVITEVVFIPSPDQRKAKASFWALYSDLGGADVSRDLAIQLSKEPKVKTWWGQPDFRDWFLNRDEFRQRLEYLAHLALDAAEEILLDPKANPSARVNMAKLVMEAGSKMPNKYEQQKFADEFINKMSKEELKQYLEKQGTKYLKPIKEGNE